MLILIFFPAFYSDSETLYQGYELLFIFDNIISLVIYIEDALQVIYMNKGLKG